MKKKLILIVAVVLSLSLVIGCSQEDVGSSNSEGSQRVVDESKIEARDKIFYVVNENEPFTGKSVVHYENNQVKIESNFKDGKPHGEQIVYREDGQIWFKGYRKDNRMFGEWVFYYRNGQVQAKENYKEGGEKHGEFIRYYKNGQVKFKANYKDGEKHGKYITYDENGEVELILNYEDGKLVH